MKSKLFGRTNINDIVFNVETQEGSAILEGDDSVASIGDATMAHIQSLTNLNRLAYDSAIQMGDGNLFEVTENPRWEDKDPFNLRYTSKDAQLLKVSSLPPERRAAIQEAMEELEAQQDTDDVMNHPEELIPYDDWERFPQMSKHWDIPSTPRPAIRFLGSTRQGFMDEFPENHPMADIINRTLITLDNYPWHRILTEEQVREYNKEHEHKPIFESDNGAGYVLTDRENEFLVVEPYLTTLRLSIFATKNQFNHKITVFEALQDMIIAIAYEKLQPLDAALKALKSIDDAWSIEYRKSVFQKTKASDPLYIFLADYSKKMLKLAKSGKDVTSQVKQFGAQLFRDGFTAERTFSKGERCNDECDEECKVKEHQAGKAVYVQKAKKHHWAKYNLLKEQISRALARKAASSVKSDAPDVKKLTGWILKLKDIAITSKSPADFRNFTGIPAQLLNKQKSKSVLLTKKEWNEVWACYNDSKSEIFLSGKPATK